jgi:hypothetical protein
MRLNNSIADEGEKQGETGDVHEIIIFVQV